jgi:hypothetical protein
MCILPLFSYLEQQPQEEMFTLHHMRIRMHVKRCERLQNLPFPHGPGGKAVTERHAIVMTEWDLFRLTNV